MATEFDNSQHWGFFLTGTKLTSETGKFVRLSELVLSALRAAGVFDIMVDGTIAPTTDKLWLDKNTDPATLKQWDATGSSWVPMTYGRLFGLAALGFLSVSGGTGNTIVVAPPNSAFQANRLYSITPTANNAAGAVTIQVTGIGTYPVKYGDGSNLNANEFSAGRQAILHFDGARFVVVFSVGDLNTAIAAAAASASAAAASAGAAATSAAAASAYADFIRNNWAVAGPFTGTGVAANYLLPIDPVSVNNMFPIVGGVVQMVTDGAYSLAYSGGNAYININVPLGVVFEVRLGNKIDVNTPVDGSVSTAKVANNAVTYAKMQDVSATARLLGRVTAGAGDPEEVTAAQVRDTFFPAGAIVDSVLLQQTTSAFGVTALIPIDNTIPQIGEGTGIFSTTFTPKKTTNKLRATIIISGASSGAGAWVGALFVAGAANAVAADIQSAISNGTVSTMKIIHEWTPGVTTAVAVAVRIGVASPYSGQTLTINPAYFGGVNHCSLLIEEIAG